jgi:Putative adhesin/Domain of unknown function (DUF5668)
MAGYPPPYPPPGPPYGYDPRSQRRFLRDQVRGQRAAFRAQRAQMRYQMRGMRRGSILGPVVLIAVGIVFLLVQTGHLDHARVWEWYGHWWPFLLVAAGLVVLAEWAVDQHLMRDPQRPQYSRSLGGGIFLVSLFFIFGGITAHGFHQFFDSNGRLIPGFQLDQDSLDQLFGDKHDSDQTIDTAFVPGSSLSVVNPRGDVTITGSSDDGRIHIAIHKQIYARTDSDAENKARQLAPETGVDGLNLNVNMPSLDGARADLIIQLPPSAATAVTANSGDVHVASIQNRVTVTANHGDVELSGITGTATVHVNNGGKSVAARSLGAGIIIQGHAQDLTLTDITGMVTINGEFFGTTHMAHIAGPIHFHTSRTDLQYVRLDGDAEISSQGITSDQVMGPVVLTTRDRNVTLSRIAGDIAVTNRNGAITLTAAPAMGNITIEDRNGEVNATLPENAGFQVDARTAHGQVNTAFPLSSSESRDSTTLTGRVGVGGPTVRIVTSNSDISLNKANVQPMPVEPPAPPKITLAPTVPGTPAILPAKASRKAKAVPFAPVP